jgi:dihydrofolate reductase
MSKVAADISMSLDGLITGPNPRAGQGLGEGGDRLHEWVYNLASWREPHGLAGGEVNRDGEILDEVFKNTGAIVIGMEMYRMAEGWGDTPPFHMPVFVLTHTAREPLAKAGGTTFDFVTDGVESAMRQARAAAGDKDVSVGGGASVIQQFLTAGLLDEIQIHLVPVLLGGGTRLFDHTGPMGIELECNRVVASPGVTHLRYRVVR